MMGRLHVALIVGVAVVVWGVVLVARGTPLTWDHFVPFGTAVGVITFLLDAFNRRCWRFAVFKGWLVQRPWLQGTWRVVLQSNFRDPATNEQIGPILCYMVFRQDFTMLTARLYTPESSSESLIASILQSPDCVFQVSAAYRNEPQLPLRGARSEMHFGAFLLDVHGEPANSLTGKYWTDRNTSGTLTLSDRRNQLITSHAEGAAMFGP